MCFYVDFLRGLFNYSVSPELLGNNSTRKKMPCVSEGTERQGRIFVSRGRLLRVTRLFVQLGGDLKLTFRSHLCINFRQMLLIEGT